MLSMRTAPKTGELLLLNIGDYNGNDWCVVGFYHRKLGWVLATDSTRIHPVGWERHHIIPEQYSAQNQHATRAT